jgi:hypothetical protein
MKAFLVFVLTIFIAIPLYARTHSKKELKPLLKNRCFQSKSPAERAKWIETIDGLSDAEFTKTMRDLDAINAGDRLLGNKGCEAGNRN